MSKEPHWDLSKVISLCLTSKRDSHQRSLSLGDRQLSGILTALTCYGTDSHSHFVWSRNLSLFDRVEPLSDFLSPSLCPAVLLAVISPLTTF